VNCTPVGKTPVTPFWVMALKAVTCTDSRYKVSAASLVELCNRCALGAAVPLIATAAQSAQGARHQHTACTHWRMLFLLSKASCAAPLLTRDLAIFLGSQNRHSTLYGCLGIAVKVIHPVTAVAGITAYLCTSVCNDVNVKGQLRLGVQLPLSSIQIMQASPGCVWALHLHT